MPQTPNPLLYFIVLTSHLEALDLCYYHDDYNDSICILDYTPKEAIQMDGPSTSTSSENPYNRIWRICFDPLDDPNDSSRGQKYTSANFSGSESFRRRRYMEESFPAWALLQKAVLCVTPESPDQLVPGTRVCAVWSPYFGRAYFPGRITDSGAPVRSDSTAEITFLVQFDDGDRNSVPFRSILLLPDDYKSPKEPSPMPSGRRRLRSPVRSPDFRSNPARTRSRSGSRVGSDEGKIETNTAMTDGSGDGKPDEMTVIWTPIGTPLKSRYKGMICYRAFQRNPDGLVVRLNDMVTFMTANKSESYLGRIENIYSTRTNTFRVTANWLYTPREMGSAGDLVANFEGAVFTSSHYDDNDAFCISEPVRVASSYSEFCTARRKRARRKSTASSTTATSSTATSTRRRWRRLTLLESDEEEEEGRDTSDEEAVANRPQYFIAGAYDFVKCRVVTWDSDLAAELHLPAKTNQHPR
ncbi:hypothetical protein Aperf_G00000052140 [Anoplocephala perfoliata]